MKVYPTSDPDFFIEQPNNWELYCRHPANYVWKSSNAPVEKTINHYRDIEGARKDIITDKDLYFQCWPNSRLKPGACLPVFYALGERFIKLEKADPLGFKCAPMPMSLSELRRKIVDDEKAMKKNAKKARFNELLKQECKKTEKRSKKST